MPMDSKDTLLRYLQVARDALLWKLDGLSEYDMRRPMTATGTNLLGIVKHVASVEAGYLGDCFGRPFPQDFPWFADDAEFNDDFLVGADETSASIIDFYRRVWAHSDETVRGLPIDAPGRVPWWGDRAEVTLHQILVHITTETHRHAGHADIVREMIDGAVGLGLGRENMPPVDDDWWASYRAKVEAAAQAASG